MNANTGAALNLSALRRPVEPPALAPRRVPYVHVAASASRVRVLSIVLLCVAPGCNAIHNGWLDPTVVGNFKDTSSLEIRTSLTLEDTPTGLPGATPPLPKDTLANPVEYPISGGDTLAIEINELRQRQVPYQAQVAVTAAGYVNLPVVGRVHAVGMTIPEFEVALTDALRNGDILVHPEVTVNPLFLQKATYSIFGIGVSASNNAPLRAGTFPIRRPNLDLLEAINQVGGLNEFVTDVYVFRYDEPVAGHPVPLTETEESDGDYANEPGGSNEDGRGEPHPRVDVPQSRLDEPDAPVEAAPGVNAADAAAAALIEAVVEGETGPKERTERRPDVNDASGQQVDPDVARSLEPDAPQPYLYVDGQFVPNPAYHAATGGPATSTPAAPLSTVTPAVNWSRIAGDTTRRVIHIPAEPLRDGDPQMNITVRGGDVIRIVSGEIGVYYVMGQTIRVGPFAFNSEPITLKAAIAAAGGLSGLAWPDRCTIYRRLGQREQMIQVNLDRIFAGKDPDFFIKRGDIINIGTHPFAPFLRALRGLSIPNPISNIGYSFTYARNFADIDSFAVQQNPANKPSRISRLLP